MPHHLIRIDAPDEETTERVGEIVAEVAGPSTVIALEGELGAGPATGITPGRKLGAGPATVIALEGELGAGKTRFARGIARGLGIDPDDVSSPTFVVHIEHLGPGDVAFSHLDAYRVGGEDELESIGFDELIADPNRLVAVEWASRIDAALQRERIEVRIAHGLEDARRIAILDHRRDDAARRRLAEALEARAAAFITPLGAERRCPTCDVLVESDDHRPFCSPRCRMADLERWFQGDYSISRPLDDRDEFEFDGH